MSANLQIFLSHASQDKAAALQLEQTLHTWGFSPWVDQQALAGGQRWSAELQQAVARSAALVLVVTPISLASPMVRAEYREALARQILVILLLLHPVRQLPPELAGLPALDWSRSKWRGEEHLFAVLHDLGLRPSQEGAMLGSQWPRNILLSNARRAPVEWLRYTVARGSYLMLAIWYGALTE